MKSTRFGLALELHHSYQLKRLSILLLIATLLWAVSWLVGKATQFAKQHWQYQAN